MPNPYISIIIPFYNLEDRVNRCLNSVMKQNYKDFEVVCVNDGSTDCTADALRSYALKDERIHIVNKSNGGLSDARNAGVEVSKGQYISFVDGDDVVSPFYIRSLAEAIGDSPDNLVIGKCWDIPEGQSSELLSQWEEPRSPRLLTKESACKEILTKRIPTVAVAKLISRRYYEANPFPLGVRYEEIRTIGKLIDFASEIRVIDSPIYGYLLREGSIVWTKSASVEQGIEYAEAILSALDEFEKLGFAHTSEYCFFKAIMFTRVHDFANRIADKGMAEIIEDIASTAIRESCFRAVRCESASLAQRARILLYRSTPKLYDEMMHLYNRRIKGIEIA